ncbi:MAG: methylated-DNA--[protein]-cysteine S-methyltransferase [Culicoidibacterales bacterium]
MRRMRTAAIFNQAIKTPYGWFEIVASDHYLDQLIKRDDDQIEQKPNKITGEVARQLTKYFLGELEVFDLPIYFPNSFTGQVYKALLGTNFGAKISYQELGTLAGSNAPRAVGTAMANNKIPIIIPCHRVIKSTGKLGNYAFGTEMKQQLLDFESSMLR